jgi:two-component system cell cycle sensor histidine kinase/response regulator CckA
MPHMNGRDLAERLSSVRPKMKVLFMSGHTDRAAMPDVAGESLQKPFTPETLARRVRLILDQTVEP